MSIFRKYQITNFNIKLKKVQLLMARGLRNKTRASTPPPCTKSIQYCPWQVKDKLLGGQFQNRRFIPDLAAGRITLMEVDEMLKSVNDNIKDSEDTTSYIVKGAIGVVLLLPILIVDLIFVDQSSKLNTVIQVFWGIAFFANLCYRCKQINEAMIKKIQSVQTVLDYNNEAKWHARGIHWAVESNLIWLEIQMDYDPNTGKRMGADVQYDAQTYQQYYPDQQQQAPVQYAYQ